MRSRFVGVTSENIPLTLIHRTPNPWRLVILPVVLLSVLWWSVRPLAAEPSGGATIVVNSFADDMADDELCTLREAVVAANRDRASGGCPTGNRADTILLPPGVYTLTSSDDGGGDAVAAAAAAGDLDVFRDLDIQPSGPGLVVIDGGADGARVFELLDGDVVLRGLTIRNGRADKGAGIYVHDRADLWLENVTLTGNVATQRGGALYVADDADVHLTHVTIAGNTAPTGSAIRSHGAVWPVNTLIGVNAPAGAAACEGDALRGDGPNVVVAAACATANTTVVADPGLAAWDDGGGVTFWALTEHSPAVNTGAAAACAATDQLGVARPQLGQCDIGAHELVEHTPTAAAVSATTAEDTPVTITLAGTDANNDALTFRIVQPPAVGSVGPVTPQTANSATVLYTPPAHFEGGVAFTYTASDGVRDAAPALVTLTVTPDAWLEVTTTADGGPGSLRERLNQANADRSAIVFDLPGAGPHVILLNTALPAVQYPVTLDGTTQPQGQVIVDGQGGNFPGLVILGSAGGSTVKGLTFRNFGGSGIVVQQSGGNTLTGNTLANNGGDGVTIVGDPNNPVGSGGNQVSDNVITGNQGSGVTIIDSVQNDVSGNDIAGNGGLPVDLGGDGHTPNDPTDGDDGANLGQNYPVIFRAAPTTLAADTAAAATVRLDGWLNSKPKQSYTIRVYAGDSCRADQHLIAATPSAVTTGDDGTVYFSLLTAAPLTLNQALRVTATDAHGNTSEYSDCVVVAYDNDEWPRALSLAVGGGPATVQQYLDLFGQARWYRFAVQPNTQVEVLLTGLPANYDLTLYKDLAAAYQELLQPQDLTKLSAEFAPSAFSPSAFSPSAFSPSAFSPSAFSPSAFSPSAFSPSAFSPSAFSPSAFSPSAFSPSAFSPSAFSPSAFSPSAFSPSAFSPSAFSPSAFSPSAFSGAQTVSLLGVSAFDGTAGEGLTLNTWNNTGEFYVRVRGREGAFNLDVPFRLQVTVTPGPCAALPADSTLPATSLAATAGNFKSIILVDEARLRARYPAGEVDALLAQVGVLAARAEVKGVVVDVSDDARVAAANGRADSFAACPYAKNVVAASIRALVQAYARANPLEYVVIVGNDDVIPFFRYADNALLGHESNYVPPVKDDSASQASLRLGYVLGQDAYGASVELSLHGADFPVPDLAVGRLVETPGDMLTMLAAYLGTTGGVAPTPQSAFVSGYDFLEDAALAMQSELAAGLGKPVDTLITPQEVSPLDPTAWTAAQLKAKLAGQRYDITFLAGHFNAVSALAADYSTSFLTTELLALPVNLINALFLSAGCHAGYNIVTPHGVPGVTFEPDWAQAFAQRGATLVAGTGYQYGDTDFLEYSERLYLEFARQLRTGDGPVPVGKALAAAKQRYLATTPVMRGIHEKAVLEATLFGLPMFAVNLPGARLPADDDAPVVGQTQAVSAAPGKALGLRSADLTVTPQLTERVLELTGVDDVKALQARWLEGSDGVVTNPGEPALPLESMNVSAPGLVLRGVGLRGGAYRDVADILPLTGAPTTELRGVHLSFQPEVWFPLRPWGVNYFGALTGDGVTRLNVTPAQHKSAGAAGPAGLRRQFSRLDFRLFYTPNPDDVAAAADGHGLVADAPTIIQAQGIPDGGDLLFRVRVVGNPAAGLQGVWVTYTALQGPWFGVWQSLDLTQSGQDSTLWEGRLPLQGTPAAGVRFMAQAVNGLGLVALAENLGRYYTPGGDAAPVRTTLELAPPATTVAAYGDTVTLAAVLRDGAGNALSGLPLLFGVGPHVRLGVTDANGRAQAAISLVGLPGQYLINVAFGGNAGYAASAATGSGSFTLQRQASVLTLDPPVAEGKSGDAGLVTATLVDAAGRRLVEQTVLFVIEGKRNLTQPVITNLVGQADLGAVKLPAGIYTVSVRYGGASSHTPVTSATGQLVLNPSDPTGGDGEFGGRLFLPVMQR